MMYKSLSILIGLILWNPISSFAQEDDKDEDDVKKEIEKSIDKDELPEKILRQLKDMPISLDDASFYYQEDIDSKSYEAKMDFEEKKYTIAFEKEANLQDIEIEIDDSEIPEKVMQQIKNYLEDTFQRHNIEKIQLHFKPENKDKAFSDRNHPDMYELVVATKDKKNDLGKKEIQFDSKGNHENTRKILRESSDFLIF